MGSVLFLKSPQNFLKLLFQTEKMFKCICQILMGNDVKAKMRCEEENERHRWVEEHEQRP